MEDGSVWQVNDASRIGEFERIHRDFNDECNDFHELLMNSGVKAYRCNDGWVDRKRCTAKFFSNEAVKGYYWGNMHLIAGDLIFIGNAHDGGRFAVVIKAETMWGNAIECHYYPLAFTLDGKNRKYITKNNAPKLSWWDKHIRKVKEPHLQTDIYEVWPIPEHSCLKCHRLCDGGNDAIYCNRNDCWKNGGYSLENQCEAFTIDEKIPLPWKEK